jgi:hypothetical protein
MRADLGSDNIKVSGFGFGFAFAVGGAISENLILFGEVVGTGADEPSITASGTTTTPTGQNVNLVGFGPGLAYYLGDNFYVSGTVAFSRIVFNNSDGDKLGETKLGPGVSLALGKEWWVSDNWALGMALNVHAARMKDQTAPSGEETPTWNGLGLGLMFSATFN